MKKINKIIVLVTINIFIFWMFDSLFGHWYSKVPEYLNTKNQYSSNYRNYFIKKVDTNGNAFFQVDDSVYVDRLYQNKLFEEDSFKVLAIGDSFTYGQGVKAQDTWIKKLEELSKEKKLYGINYAHSGFNIKEIFDTFQSVIKQLNPNLVVYAYVLNDPIINVTQITDLDFDNKNIYEHDYGLYYDFINYRSMVFNKNRNLVLDFFYNNSNVLNYIIHVIEKNKISKNTIKHYQDIHDPRKNEAGLAETLSLIQKMNEISNKKGSHFVVMIFPLFYHTQKDYPFLAAHQYLKTELGKRNISTLDLLPYYKGINDSELWVHPVDQHPNDYAHSIAAKAIFDWIKNEKKL